MIYDRQFVFFFKSSSFHSRAYKSRTQNLSMNEKLSDVDE